MRKLVIYSQTSMVQLLKFRKRFVRNFRILHTSQHHQRLKQGPGNVIILTIVLPLAAEEGFILTTSGPWFNIKLHLTSVGNPIVEIRRSYDRLISTMGFPIRVRQHLYIESRQCCQWQHMLVTYGRLCHSTSEGCDRECFCEFSVW